jgi:hypothetical protein
MYVVSTLLMEQDSFPPFSTASVLDKVKTTGSYPESGISKGKEEGRKQKKG